MKIAFCSSEVYPFAKTGGLADVSGALPIALEKLGAEVSIFLPHFKTVGNNGHVTRINNRISVARLGKKINVYFIENEEYFGREGLYGDSAGDYSDNLERFQFFCLESLKLMKELSLPVDVIHCHDWQTALIPVYLKEKFQQDPFYRKIKSVLTIHNLAFQGAFPKIKFPHLGLEEKLFSPNGFEFYGKINLLKAGIIFADQVTTVSQRYAKEIQTKEFGCGLEGVLSNRKNETVGILNGLDYDVWNPYEDVHVRMKFSKDDFFQAKAENKKYLQDSLDLPIDPNIPLYGFVGRLSHQKGIDLILESADDLAKMNVQVVIQGIGDEKYHSLLSELEIRYPKTFAMCLKFNEDLAHQIYAGSDFFLMPSTYEPCGLSQMISLRYGTVPIVFKTGGLADTVMFYNVQNKSGNGFVFDQYNKRKFLTAVEESIGIFKSQKDFDILRNNAIHSDFTWDQSAKKYWDLFKCLLSV